MSPDTALRRKHTSYLTDDLVRAVDRAYYERRVAEPISKQDFIEELLWTGLRSRGLLASSTTDVLARVSASSSIQSPRPARQSHAPTRLSAAPRASTAPAAAPAAAAPGQGASSEPPRERPPRLSLTDRLRAQAQPARAAMIRSAADDAGTLAESQPEPTGSADHPSV